MSAGQLNFSFDLVEEREKRDRALNLLEVHRGYLVAIAKSVADQLYLKNGRVTSPEVLAVLKEQGLGDALARVDRRFMGAVFREGSGWTRISWENRGSHRRPVSVWVKRELNSGVVAKAAV